MEIVPVVKSCLSFILYRSFPDIKAEGVQKPARPLLSKRQIHHQQSKKAADKTLSTAAKKQTAVYWNIRKQNSKTSNLESNSCRLLFSYFQAPYNVLKYQIVRSYNQCRTYRITLHSPFPLHIIVIIATHGYAVKCYTRFREAVLPHWKKRVYTCFLTVSGINQKQINAAG